MKTRSSVLLLTLACIGSIFVPNTASGAVVEASSSLQVFSTDDSNNISFIVARYEFYNFSFLRYKLQQLRSAALSYASDHGGFLPDLASDLFAEGYITDPRVFYSDGDVNSSPTTINNDVPDASESAQISFGFPAAGIENSGSLCSTVIFEDNSVSNNAGLGKFITTLCTSVVEFVPAVSRVLSQITVEATPATPGTIFYSGDPTTTPYSFDMPSDALIESKVGPHQIDLKAEGTISQELLDIFSSEGFAHRNQITMQTWGGLEMGNTLVVGPASSSVELLAFIQASVLISAPTDSVDDFLAILVIFASRNLATAETQTASRALVGNQDFGLEFSGPLSIVNHQILPSSDPRYIPGMTSVELQLTAQLPVVVNTIDEYKLEITVVAYRFALVEPDSIPGDFASVGAQFLTPVTPDQTQVKLYVPAGYTLLMNDPNGPNDLILPAIKGDSNLDGIIGPSDQAALIAAYTRPLGGNGYAPASLDEFATFDFEGDGDIDCADHQRLKDAWNAGGSPGAFSLCDNDADGDGIPNGDDDCANTPAGGLTGQTGCLLGDFDLDGDVNAADIVGFVDCMNGQSRLPSPASTNTIAACLNTFDFDSDYDIDLEDFAAVQRLSQ